jgi:hypothetical protein
MGGGSQVFLQYRGTFPIRSLNLKLLYYHINEQCLTLSNIYHKSIPTPTLPQSAGEAQAVLVLECKVIPTNHSAIVNTQRDSGTLRTCLVRDRIDYGLLHECSQAVGCIRRKGVL